MHELTLMADVMRKVERVAGEAWDYRGIAVHIWLGALARISPEHLRDHFELAARGGVAERAIVGIERSETGRPERPGDRARLGRGGSLMAARAPVGRRRVRVSGVVQGIGFRPFVHALARTHALAGTCATTAPAGMVVLETELGGSRVVDRLAGDPRPRIC